MGTAGADTGSSAREDVGVPVPATTAVRRTPLDPESRRWVDRLRAGHPRREVTIAELTDLLRRVASSELGRRRHRLGWVSGHEFDDLAQQAADDAAMKILDRLDDFRGLSRFTTWAYKFAVFEISDVVARHTWRRQAPNEEPAWERIVDVALRAPEDQIHQRAQLRALSRAIGELTDRQREVFVSIALNGVAMDVVAMKLGTNRNAVYKNLFDARRSLRSKLATAGYPVGD
jgi:RNA polymerase sigma-70 factor (ECF subfamily)